MKISNIAKLNLLLLSSQLRLTSSYIANLNIMTSQLKMIISYIANLNIMTSKLKMIISYIANLNIMTSQPKLIISYTPNLNLLLLSSQIRMCGHSVIWNYNVCIWHHANVFFCIWRCQNVPALSMIILSPDGIS